MSRGQPWIRPAGHPTASLHIILSKGEHEIMTSTNLKMMVKWVMILPATEFFSHVKAVIKTKM